MTAVYVYRCYGPDDRLLYVGQSKNPMLRWQQHMFEHTWWAERVAHWQVEVWPNRDAARRAERDAITYEHPVYNTQHFGPGTREKWSQQQYVEWTRARLEMPYSQPSNMIPTLREEYALRFGRSLRDDVGRVQPGRRRQYGGSDDRTRWRTA